MILYFNKKLCFDKRTQKATGAEFGLPLNALHSRNSLNNSNSDASTIISSQVPPPYSLHDENHQLPKIDDNGSGRREWTNV